MSTHYGPEGDFRALSKEDRFRYTYCNYDCQGLERIRKHQEWMETDSRFATECPDLDQGVTDKDMKDDFDVVTGPAPKLATENRKQYPMARGLLDYFPKALAAVAHCSWHCNEQHNAGEPMHWAREKSTDEADALLRHLVDRGLLDTDGIRHSVKVAWRALAMLERELDGEKV